MNNAKSLENEPRADSLREFLPNLSYRPFQGRTLVNSGLSLLTVCAALIACVPLFSILIMLVHRGGKTLRWACLTELPPAALQTGGGFGNAVVGTVVMVGIAAAMAVPLGVMAAIFLAVLGPNSRLATSARFGAKLLSGLPSILAGVFAYAAVVMVLGSYSAVAGGIALGVLMLPIVVLTTEEAMKMVPPKMTEAAVGLGSTQSQVVCRVILPTSFPGIMTGVMLASARAAGETAPLLFTALFSNYWLFDEGRWQFMEPTASLAVFIYNFSGSPFDNQVEMAWAAALVLVLLVLGLNVAAQMLSRWRIRL